MKTLLRIIIFVILVVSFTLPVSAQISWKSNEAQICKTNRLNDANHKALKKLSTTPLSTQGTTAVVYFTDKTIFLNYVFDLTTENFDHSNVEYGDMASFEGVLNNSTDNYVFSEGSIVPGVEFRALIWDELILLASQSYFDTELNLLATNYWCDELELTFVNPVKALAFTAFETGWFSTAILYLYDSSDELIAEIPIGSYWEGAFLGVISTTPIKYAVIISDCEGTAIGELMFGNNITPSRPILTNMEEFPLFYGNTFALRRVTNTTSVGGPATCSGATIKITSNYTRGKDILMLNPGTGLMNRFDLISGTLTLSGIAPTSVYQNALRNILYMYASPTIPVTTPDKVVSFTVYNGSEASNTLTRTITFNNLDKSVSEEVDLATDQKPSEYCLYQNYPNPFNPVTNIRFAIPKDGFVSLKIYNFLGEEVAILMNNYATAGTYQIPFDGSKLSSGTYFYRLTSGNFAETKKFVLVK